MTEQERTFGCVTCNANPERLVTEQGASVLYCATHTPADNDGDELCHACRPLASSRNHPPGMIFVGWGIGWQACTRCGGSGLEKTRHCNDKHCELPFGHDGAHRMGLYIKVR